jgi:hypothetical protein
MSNSRKTFFVKCCLYGKYRRWSAIRCQKACRWCNYHIVGSLIAAPTSLVRKQLDACVGLAAVAEQATVILTGLTPRYVSGPCCDNPTHLNNFGKDDLEEDILEALEMPRKILLSWAGSHGLRSCYISASTLITPMETCKSSHGWSLLATDRFHLSPLGYRDLAAAIMKVAHGGLGMDDWNAGALSESLAPKTALPGISDYTATCQGKKITAAEGGGSKIRVPPTADCLISRSSQGNVTGGRERQGCGNCGDRGSCDDAWRVGRSQGGRR